MEFTDNSSVGLCHSLVQPTQQDAFNLIKMKKVYLCLCLCGPILGVLECLRSDILKYLVPNVTDVPAIRTVVVVLENAHCQIDKITTTLHTINETSHIWSLNGNLVGVDSYD